VRNCLHLIEVSRLLKIPVLVTEQYPKGLGQTLEEIKTALPEYRPVEKITFNCCEEKEFMNLIASINKKSLFLQGSNV